MNEEPLGVRNQNLSTGTDVMKQLPCFFHMDVGGSVDYSEIWLDMYPWICFNHTHGSILCLTTRISGLLCRFDHFIIVDTAGFPLGRDFCFLHQAHPFYPLIHPCASHLEACELHAEQCRHASAVG